MNTRAKLSRPTLRRLPLYHRRLLQAIEQGAAFVSSDELGEAADASAAQVRKDLSHLAEYGRPGVGYETRSLCERLEQTLGIADDKEAVLVGLGNMGRALALHPGFVDYGLTIIALFDNDPSVIGQTVGGRRVQSVDKLARAIRRFEVQMGIIAVPAETAQQVADIMVANGVKIIWNFAPVRLNVPIGVKVRNEDLAAELATLSHDLEHAATGEAPAAGNPASQAEAEQALGARTIFGVWADQVVDNRREEQEELPAFHQLEQLVEFEPGNKIFAIMGWDGFFLFDERADLIDMARAYMQVVQQESCGKCVPCRMGTRVAADILTRIADGQGTEEDLKTLRKVGELVRAGSMCELGHGSMNAVLALLDYFEEDFQLAVTMGIRHPRGKYHVKVTAPCIEACPERLDIPRYIEYIKSGRYTESLSVIHEKNPLASVCGRVCVRFCEFACRRGKLDDPVSIKHLKRFVGDVEYDAAVKKYGPKIILAPNARRVAIIGAGPAGMTAAYHLLRKGYRVEIFEALDEPGGMAAVGIPDYRLPREVLRTEIEIIEHMGARIHYKQRLGRDFTLQDLKDKGFDAIFVAIGAQLGTRLGVPGEDEKPVGYYPAIEFLRCVNQNDKVPVGHTAVVVGGGNVAIDSARSALRLGIEKVHLVYRRVREAMPADKVEVHDAEAEGVEFHFLSNPTRLVIEDGKVVGVECLRMELGEPDASGMRSPVPVAGSEFVIPCDVVIPAIGQRVDNSCLQGPAAPDCTRRGTVVADGDTLVTNADGVFAGGDCVSGPATLIEAMAAGLRVSNSIEQYLREGKVSLTEDERMGRVFRAVSTAYEDEVDRLGGRDRKEPELRSVDDRVDDFEEVEIGLAPEDALLEADRCLRCYRILLVATDK